MSTTPVIKLFFLVFSSSTSSWTCWMPSRLPSLTAQCALAPSAARTLSVTPQSLVSPWWRPTSGPLVLRTTGVCRSTSVMPIASARLILAPRASSVNSERKCFFALLILENTLLGFRDFSTGLLSPHILSLLYSLLQSVYFFLLESSLGQMSYCSRLHITAKDTLGWSMSTTYFE